MKLGVCANRSEAGALAGAGWDFVEENVQGFLKGLEPTWQTPDTAVLPVPAANSLVPGSLPIVGPNADATAVQKYMANVLTRAGQAKLDTLVFGSGAARKVPEGVDRETAFEQIVAFLKQSADVAADNGVTLMIEPLNAGECNIINSVAEAMTYVRAVDHPNVQCLVDSYHFWLENEPLDNLVAAMPSIRHVHVADREGRTPPGESGSSDYVPFFRVLRQGGYDGRISVECRGWNTADHGEKVLAYLKNAWEQAAS